MHQPVYLGLPLLVACAASLVATIVTHQWFMYGHIKFCQKLGQIVLQIFPDTGEFLHVVIKNPGAWRHVKPKTDFLSLDEETTFEKFIGPSWHKSFKPQWYTTPLLTGTFITCPIILIMIAGEMVVGEPIPFAEAYGLFCIIFSLVLVAMLIYMCVDTRGLTIYILRFLISAMTGMAVLVNLCDLISFVTSRMIA